MPLTPDLIAEFNHQGYLVVRGLADEKVCEKMRAVTRSHLERSVGPLEYEAEVGYPGAPRSFDEPGGKTVRRLRDAYHRDPLFRAWAENPCIVAWLEQRFGEAVSLTLSHHNCVMTKHPRFGSATGWHRDIRYWSFLEPDLVTVWLALGNEAPENGGLQLIPRSHDLAISREQLDGLDFLRTDAAENAGLFTQGVNVELQAGDVLLFHSKLFHAAGRNNSEQVKCSLVFAYHARSNAPRPGSRSALPGSIAVSSDGGQEMAQAADAQFQTPE